MGNLVDDLGAPYVNQYFQGAFLKDDEGICQFIGMRSANVAVVEKFLPEGGNGWQEVEIPAERLKNFASFSSPPLGYRNIIQNGAVQAVLHLTAQRSTRRGFRIDNIRTDRLPVFDVMSSNPEIGQWDFLDRWSRTKLVYFPEYIGLKKGLKDLLAGNSVGFAVNKDIAVAIDMDIAAKFPWSIYFKSIRVGGIDESGTITVHNKIVNRREVRSQLEILE